jgi:hypothetical protein
VSEETMADAGAPLTIRWLTGSFIDSPCVADVISCDRVRTLIAPRATRRCVTDGARPS